MRLRRRTRRRPPEHHLACHGRVAAESGLALNPYPRIIVVAACVYRTSKTVRIGRLHLSYHRALARKTSKNNQVASTCSGGGSVGRAERQVDSIGGRFDGHHLK